MRRPPPAARSCQAPDLARRRYVQPARGVKTLGGGDPLSRFREVGDRPDRSWSQEPAGEPDQQDPDQPDQLQGWLVGYPCCEGWVGCNRKTWWGGGCPCLVVKPRWVVFRGFRV